MMGSARLVGSGLIVSEPFYRRVLVDLRARIASGEWPHGTKLPTTRELVEQYRTRLEHPELSHLTVRRAVEILIETRELRGQQGLGVYVGDAGPDPH